MPRSLSPPPDRRGIRRLLLGLRGADRDPLIVAGDKTATRGGAGIASAALRGLGCVSSSVVEARAPGLPPSSPVRSSADWRSSGRRRRRRKRESSAATSGGIGDIWCAPGIPFAAAETSVDCVVTARHPIGDRTRSDQDRAYRESLYVPRRMTMREEISSPSPDSPPHNYDPLFDFSLLPSGRLRHLRGRRHSAAAVLEDEIVMFHSRILLGGMNIYDQYQDWRLDVDNMSYEELLELGDKIGYVSTGLREDEISRSLERARYMGIDSELRFPTEVERKCSICQEEHEMNEETWRLECGHSYHVYCIKQWLSRKNACPVCKTAVHL